MPMPHRTYKQVIKRRLVGKEGSERTRELRVILAELPNYKNGPYADLRKWVQGQLEETRTRSRVIHRDSISVQREGAAQIAFVGPPNAGKSELVDQIMINLSEQFDWRHAVCSYENGPLLHIAKLLQKEYTT